MSWLLFLQSLSLAVSVMLAGACMARALGEG
jgi:hypothetical protein